MTRLLLENLSKTKLRCLMSFVAFSWIIGLFIAHKSPNRINSEDILLRKCQDEHPRDDNLGQDFNNWITTNCTTQVDDYNIRYKSLKNLVFVDQMLLFDKQFLCSQHKLVGLLQMNAILKNMTESSFTNKLTMDSRLAYSDKNSKGSQTPWKRYSQSEKKRNTDCIFSHFLENLGYIYNCSMIFLFELGNFCHDYFLLNLELPYDIKRQKNLGIYVVDLKLIRQIIDMELTNFLLYVKLSFLVLTIACLFFFCWKLKNVHRSLVYLEKLLLSLGLFLIINNIPVRYFPNYSTQFIDCVQNIFPQMLLFFLLILYKEGMVINHHDKESGLKLYGTDTFFVVGLVVFTAFNIIAGIWQINDPFSSFWNIRCGYFTFIVSMMFFPFCLILMGYVMCRQVFKVPNYFKNTLSIGKKIFVIVISFFCALFIVISIILDLNGKVNNVEMPWQFPIYMFTYCNWNVFLWVMLILYSSENDQPSSEYNRVLTPSSPFTDSQQIIRPVSNLHSTIAFYRRVIADIGMMLRNIPSENHNPDDNVIHSVKIGKQENLITY